MRLKKILIVAGSTILLSSPLIALAFVNFFPKTELSSKRFIINDTETEIVKADLKQALDNTIGTGENANLTLKFYTLTKSSQYTPSKLAWFSELNRALKWLDPRLSFELIPRSNQTVEQGFRQKDGEMISMFWSPDYHNIGTWLGFWFNGNYTVPNLWPSLYVDMTDGSLTPWQNDLKEYLESIPVNGGTGNYFQSYDELNNIDEQNYMNGNKTSYRSSIGDEIGYWADTTEQQNAIDFVAWMNAQSPMLPWVSDGPSSTKKLMVREGFHSPTNTYSADTYRDWYYDGQNALSQKFRYWLANDPFATNKTPYNPSFNDTTNNSFFQSTYNGLTDWKINGDWEWDNESNTWIAPKGTLTLSGASKLEMFDSGGSNVGAMPKIGSLSNQSSIEDFVIYESGNEEETKKMLEQATTYKFQIDPTRFKWYSMSGETSSYLTAKDYFWGFMGYVFSVQLNLNTNGYYLDLINLDVPATIKANEHFFDFYYPNASEMNKYSPWNLKPKLDIDNEENNTITFVLKKPNVNFLDILSKQYFQPLPIDNVKVQNIFAGPNGKYLVYNLGGNPSDIKTLSPTLNLSKTNFTQLYGCESDPASNNFDWWSSGAYYVNGITEQDISFAKNNQYFNQFPDGMYGDKNQKIGQVIMKYGGAFSDQITYIQYKNNELDKSNIPISLIPEAAKLKGFTTQGVDSVSRTDIISYNTNVFQRDSNGITYLTSVPSSGKGTVVETLDGQKRVLKPNISKNYYEAIVKDFSQPNGNSMKIRKAINIAIDWFSLAAMAVPDDNPNFQQSVIPYGNFKVVDNDTNTTFTELANNDSNLALARNGVNGWTIDSYLKNWLKQFGTNRTYITNKKNEQY